MIEETATVLRREGQRIWVQPERQSTCGHCAVRAGCGTAVLGKWLGRKQPPLELLDETGAMPGEQVRLGIREAALLRGSLLVYLLPLLALVAGALTAELLGLGEGAVILGGLLGLAAGFLLVARRHRAMAGDPRYRPMVIARITAAEHPVTFHTAQRD